MKKLLLIIILSVGLISTACSQQSKQSAGSIPVISADSLKASMGNPKIVILDVRTPEEFAEGHVKGAVNVDYRSADFAAKVDKLDKSKKYEVYCRSGHRSGESVKLMKEKGFNAVSVTGGILEWQAKGFPVEK